jgi:hypothetical protein
LGILGAYAGALLIVSALVSPADGQFILLDERKAGFVVSDISYVLCQDASETGAFLNGLTTNEALAGLFNGASGQQQAQPSEAQQQAFRRDFAGSHRIGQFAERYRARETAAAGAV